MDNRERYAAFIAENALAIAIMTVTDVWPKRPLVEGPRVSAYARRAQELELARRAER